MEKKKICPNCGNRSMILEQTSVNDNNFLRTPLVCKECGHIDLIMEEEQEAKMFEKQNSMNKIPGEKEILSKRKISKKPRKKQ
ncbi:MAG: hypothetical protein AABX83_00730 [Nanoarchaeota archaeon]